MNRNRVIISGLAAGVFWTVVDFAVHGGILAGSYLKLGQAGVINAEPAIPFLPLLVVANLIVGLVIAFLYAAARPRLGPGPKTALCIGLCVFLVLIPPTLSQMAWFKLTPDINTWTVIGGLIQTFGASLVAGWLYRE